MTREEVNTIIVFLAWIAVSASLCALVLIQIGDRLGEISRHLGERKK